MKAKLTEWALKKMIKFDAGFLSDKLYDTFFPMPVVEGTVLFDGVKFKLDNKLKIFRMELLLDGEVILEYDPVDINDAGELTVLLEEAIMRVKIY